MTEKVSGEDSIEISPIASDQEILYEAHVDPGYWRTVAGFLAITISAIPVMPIVLPLAWAYYKSYRVYLTRTAIIIRSGICNISTATIPLDRVTDITMEENCFDRCYAYSALQVRSLSNAVM